MEKNKKSFFISGCPRGGLHPLFIGNDGNSGKSALPRCENQTPNCIEPKTARKILLSVEPIDDEGKEYQVTCNNFDCPLRRLHC